MNTENLSKLKSRFVSREVDKELILVPLTGNIAKMNEFELWEEGNSKYNQRIWGLFQIFFGILPKHLMALVQA